MEIEQTRLSPDTLWTPSRPGNLAAAQLVMVFGGRRYFEQPHWAAEIKKCYPQAHLWGCSTAGEICSTQVTDDALVVTAIRFADTRIASVHTPIRDMDQSYAAGEHLARSLSHEGLVHVLVLSDGLKVNGSDLVRGLTDALPPHVTITGGLAGDDTRFQQTFVLCDDLVAGDTITVLGLYGPRIKIGYGSLGGWDSFGPERLITRSAGNVLYALDGRSALELYKKYLGEHAAGLPATGLLFPLSVRLPNRQSGVVRTILSIDEAQQSLTFAGDVPEGAYARLMKANFDRLIDGAMGAARTSHAAMAHGSAELALLISCVGRKMVLKQRVEEEVEGVRDILGPGAFLTGFYSYGEISPFTPEARCELHNQTMTITTFAEI